MQNLWLLLSVGGVAVSALMIAAQTHRALTVAQRRFELQCQRLDKEIKTLSTGALGMGQRILALEGKLNHLENVPSSVAEPTDYAYSQAKQMFAQGADIDTVASNCGFSSSEAELMALIHQRMAQEQAEA